MWAAVTERAEMFFSPKRMNILLSKATLPPPSIETRKKKKKRKWGEKRQQRLCYFIVPKRKKQKKKKKGLQLVSVLTSSVYVCMCIR